MHVLTSVVLPLSPRLQSTGSQPAKYWLNLSTPPPRFPFVCSWFPLKVMLMDAKKQLKSGWRLRLIIQLLYENGEVVPNQERIMHVEGADGAATQGEASNGMTEQKPGLSDVARPPLILPTSGNLDVRVRINDVSMQHENRSFCIRVSGGPVEGESKIPAYISFLPATSPPLTVVRHALKILDQPPPTWYKDEGGRDKCIAINAQLVDSHDAPVMNREVALKVILCYEGEDQSEVKNQSILKMPTDIQPKVDRSGKVAVRVRIEDVSKNHQKQAFVVKITPDLLVPEFHDISPVLSSPIIVLSKRNKRRYKRDAEGGDSPELHAQQHSAAFANAAMFALGAQAVNSTLNLPFNKNTANTNVNALLNPAALAQSAASSSVLPAVTPSGTLAKPNALSPTGVGVGGGMSKEVSISFPPSLSPTFAESISHLINWSQHVADLLSKIEWQHVGFEVTEGGELNLHRPLYRCPGCFTPDHQLLTEEGWMDIDQIHTRNKARPHQPLQVASFNRVCQTIEYHAPIDIIDKEHNGLVVDITHESTAKAWTHESCDEYGRSVWSTEQMDAAMQCQHDTNAVSLCVTDDHHMAAKLGEVESNGEIEWRDDDYRIMRADELLVTENDVSSCVKLPCIASNGYAHPPHQPSDISLPFIDALQLYSDDAVDAFLELYGHWLKHSSSTHHTSAMPPFPSPLILHAYNATHARTLSGLLKRAGLSQCDDFSVYQLPHRSTPCIHVHQPQWIDYFQQPHMYTDADSTPPSHTGCNGAISASHTTHHGKVVQSWLWRLDKRRLRCVIRGMAQWKHDGHDDAKEESGEILASDAPLRDDLVRLLLHAGYAAHVTLHHSSSDSPCWMLHYSESTSCSDPTFISHRDIRSRHYQGRVWCVTLPPQTDHLIIVRRVRIDQHGLVRHTSRPTIVGNCWSYQDTIRQTGHRDTCKIAKLYSAYRSHVHVYLQDLLNVATGNVPPPAHNPILPSVPSIPANNPAQLAHQHSLMAAYTKNIQSSPSMYLEHIPSQTAANSANAGTASTSPLANVRNQFLQPSTSVTGLTHTNSQIIPFSNALQALSHTPSKNNGNATNPSASGTTAAFNDPATAAPPSSSSSSSSQDHLSSAAMSLDDGSGMSRSLSPVPMSMRVSVAGLPASTPQQKKNPSTSSNPGLEPDALFPSASVDWSSALGALDGPLASPGGVMDRGISLMQTNTLGANMGMGTASAITDGMMSGSNASHGAAIGMTSFASLGPYQGSADLFLPDGSPNFLHRTSSLLGHPTQPEPATQPPTDESCVDAIHVSFTPCGFPAFGTSATAANIAASAAAAAAPSSSPPPTASPVGPWLVGFYQLHSSSQDLLFVPLCQCSTLKYQQSREVETIFRKLWEEDQKLAHTHSPANNTNGQHSSHSQSRILTKKTCITLSKLKEEALLLHYSLQSMYM